MQIPDFELTAVSSNRPFRLSDQLGKPLLLAFVGYKTASQLEQIIKPIRLRFRDTDQLGVAAIVDVSMVPRLMKSTVRGIMNAAYAEAAKQIPSGYDPADYLILLPDWEGTVLQSFNITNVNQQIAVVGLNPSGAVVAKYQGDDPTTAAMDIVEKLLEAG